MIVRQTGELKDGAKRRRFAVAGGDPWLRRPAETTLRHEVRRDGL